MSLEEVMKGDAKEGGERAVRMELKYCEHCGGLWLRECGEGLVYCEKCQARVAELPVAKKKSGRVILPVRPHTAVEDFRVESDDDGPNDMEAAGGVA